MTNRLSLAIALAAATLAAGAQADVPFDQIIVFGASYDDSGQFPDLEVDNATGLRFTNVDPATGLRGRSLPEWLALDLGIGEMNPSAPILFPFPAPGVARTDTVDTNNINFAVGGYRSEEVLQSVVGTQVLGAGGFSNSQPGFLQRVAAGTLTVGPNTLYYALPAGNDMRDRDDPAQTADVSAQIVEALVGAGARYIVLPTLPKLGSFAERSNYDANGRTQLGLDRTAASLAFNAEFEQRLLGMDGNFIRVDITTLFDEVLADPVSFGYAADIDQTRSCYDAGAIGGPGCDEPAGRGLAAGGDPDDFVFNDGLHPTQAAARTAADLIESVIRAPGIFAIAPEMVVGDARGFQNTLDNHFVQTRWDRPPAGWQVFASVQGVSADIADAWSTPAADSDSTDLTIGLSHGLGTGWVIGAAIGSQSSEAEIDDRGSEIEADGLMGSLFAGYRCDDWFADLALSAGSTDLDNIDRVLEIGTVQLRQEHGETEAELLGLAADVGVDMMGEEATLRFGPFLGLEYLSAEVDGYAEDGASSSAMAFADYERESLLGRAGVFASYPLKLGGAMLDLHGDVAYFEEFEDDTDEVEAVNKNLASGPWFRMPGYEIDSNGIRASVGADAAWQSGLRVGVSYRYDDNDVETNTVGLNASFAF